MSDYKFIDSMTHDTSTVTDRNAERICMSNFVNDSFPSTFIPVASYFDLAGSTGGASGYSTEQYISFPTGKYVLYFFVEKGDPLWLVDYLSWYGTDGNDNYIAPVKSEAGYQWLGIEKLDIRVY